MPIILLYAHRARGDLGWLSIDAVLGRTAMLKNSVRFPRTIL